MAAMLAQNIVALRNLAIERRTGVYGRLSQTSLVRQARAHANLRNIRASTSFQINRRVKLRQLYPGIFCCKSPLHLALDIVAS